MNTTEVHFLANLHANGPIWNTDNRDKDSLKTQTFGRKLIRVQLEELYYARRSNFLYNNFLIYAF